LREQIQKLKNFRLMQSKLTKTSFEGQSIYVGIDVHKKNWKVTILGEQYEHKTFNQDPKASILINYLERNFPGAKYQAAYEAGFSGFGTYRSLRAGGVECIVVHPADIPTNDKERDQKCDLRDSRKLASCLRARQLKGIYVPEPVSIADRSLVRLRTTLAKELARTKNRVKSLLMFNGIEIPSTFNKDESKSWSKRYMEWLEKLPVWEDSLGKTLGMHLQMGKQLRSQILNVTKQIRQLSVTERYKREAELLLTIPGIGLTTAMILLTELGDMKRFKTLDSLCSYVGLVPSTYSSGEKQRIGKLTRRGKIQ
jgi:transposase